MLTTSKLPRIVLVAIVTLVAGFAGAGCGGDDEPSGAATSGAGTSGAETSGAETSSAEEPQSVELLLSFNIGLVWAPVIAAQEVGYFEDQGLDVDVQETDGTSFVTQQLIAGNADYGFASAAGALIAATKDPELRVVGCQEQRNIFFVNVPSDSPIQSVTDLDGKTVGIGDEASGEGPLMQAIKNENDLDIEILPLGFDPAQIVPALEDGTVDAFAAGITPTTALETSGRIEVRDITPEKYAPMPADCLMVKQATLDDPAKRDIVVKLLRSLSQGARFVRANPDAALELACEAAPGQCEGEARERFARPYIERVVEVERPIDGDTPFEVNVDGWNVAADLMVEAGVIESKPDIATFADSAEIQAVQEEAQDYDVAAVEEDAQNFTSAG